MMKGQLSFFLVIFFTCINVSIYAQNVGINSTGNSPSGDAGLDIDFTNKGLLIPRVSLANTGTYGLTGGGPTTSMLVYNTNAGIAGTGAAGAGYYYWNGTLWSKLLAPSDAWLTKGNAGTNPTTNFIGTTNNVDLVFRTNNTERMRILNNGNVGIGTTTPNQKLRVAGGNIWLDGGRELGWDLINTDRASIRFESTGDQPGGSKLILETFDNGNEPIEFRQSGNVRMVISEIGSGNIGIGTTTPGARLVVIDTNQLTSWVTTLFKGYHNINSHFIFQNEVGGNASVQVRGKEEAGVKFLNLTMYPNANNKAGILGNVGSFYINAGNVLIGGATTPAYQLELTLNSAAKPGTNTWTVISDKRLKNITGNYTKGLSELLQLQPIKYYYKNPEGDTLLVPEVLKKENVGFIAQDVAKVFPEAVNTAPNGYLGLDIHPLLIAYLNAIKELKAENDELKKQNGLLKAELEKRTSDFQAEITQHKSELENLQTRIEKLEQIITIKAENK